ncbi:major capsid protein [Rhizobium sp. NLR8a]|uniref:major capsid protein n=1 Tax=Rhizobium TaxID=379 RepID=UPI001C82D65B|nr:MULTISPECIES: major capsid protein [Rhizobium]MBX5153223.1 major capsid protein [Rhizobium lentis]MBX5220896.1 major capsid protein [Rhizobium sp. NLR8a]
MHMDIFNDDAFSAVTMTEALEDFEFKPSLIGSMNLFEDVPIATTKVSVERRANTMSIIPTTMRGEPLPEGKLDGRNIRKITSIRIAKGHTLHSSSIQDVRAFGKENEVETMITHVARYTAKLLDDVEVTWENMRLGAVFGKVLDADGSTIVDWFSEWGIALPEEIDFGLTSPTTNIEQKCRSVLRKMMNASRGAWRPTTKVVGLAGDSFFDNLTGHATVRAVYLNTAQAQTLNAAFGAATQSTFNAGSYAVFDYGGILFINYRGSDIIQIESTKCKFFPLNAPGVFQQAWAPGESFEFTNTLGRPLYSMLIRDRDRNMWVRPEVYSYPLFICTRPEMLLSAKENDEG